LHLELAQTGAPLLLKAVKGLAEGTLNGTPQDESAVTLAPLLKKTDGALDPAWTRAELLNRFRAFKARPGAYLRLNGVDVKVHALADGGPGHGEAGRVEEVGPQGYRFRCKDGSLWLERLQAPNGKPMAALDHANGHQIKAGARVEKPELGERG
jgi:methionyl-tRNA formyltransferase